METLDLEGAIAAWDSFPPEVKAKVELGSAKDVDLAIEIVGRFLARGHDQGWSFDESLEWSRSDPPARGVDEMLGRFRELVLVRRDGAAARRLRDHFLGFLPPEQAHVPILEAIYARGGALEEDGTPVWG